VNVGYVLAGRPGYRLDRRRSTTLGVWAPIFAVQGVAFVCLQRDVSPADRATLRAAGHELPPPPVDWLDTARRVQTLDLVVSVDTAVAHLAGGLGVPVWILLPAPPDPRWGLTGDRTPWYGSARLYRQPREWDWATPVARVARDLGALVAARATVPTAA
jgi:hypothetical protein